MSQPPWDIWTPNGRPDWRSEYVDRYNARFPQASVGLGQGEDDPSQVNTSTTNDEGRSGAPQSRNSQSLGATPNVRPERTPLDEDGFPIVPQGGSSRQEVERSQPSTPAAPPPTPAPAPTVPAESQGVNSASEWYPVRTPSPDATARASAPSSAPQGIRMPGLSATPVATSRSTGVPSSAPRLIAPRLTAPRAIASRPIAPRPVAPRSTAPHPNPQPVLGQAQGFAQLSGGPRRDPRASPGLFETPPPDPPAWMGFALGNTTRPQQGGQHLPRIGAEPQPQGPTRPVPQSAPNAPGGLARPRPTPIPNAVPGPRGPAQSVTTAFGGSSSFPPGVNPAATMARRGPLAPPAGFQPPLSGSQHNTGMPHAPGTQPDSQLEQRGLGRTAYERASTASRGGSVTRQTGSSNFGGSAETTRPKKRVAAKPWVEAGMTMTRYYREQTPWGKEGLTKGKWLKKQGLSHYLYKKLERGERMRAQEAAAAAGASQEPAEGTEGTVLEGEDGQELEEAEENEEDDEEYDEEDGEEYDDDDDDDEDSRGRDGAPSPDSGAEYAS